MDKSLVANLLIRANAFAPFRFLNRAKLPVLMYHRFSEGEEFGKTSRQTFETHLNYLVRNYDLISLSEAVKKLDDGNFHPRSAVLTIDDGYDDFCKIAYPVLKKFEVPATLYVVTNFVDGKSWIWTDVARFIATRTKRDRVTLKIGDRVINRDLNGKESRLSAAGVVNAELKKLPDDEKDAVLADIAKSMNVEVPEIPPNEFGPLSWDRAREMEANGVEIGSHTVSHPILTNVDNERLCSELEHSRNVIEEKLQKDKIHFCYPNGNFGERERNAAETAGYASAVTTEIRLCENIEDKFSIPRIDAEPELHRFVQATSGFDRIKSRLR